MITRYFTVLLLEDHRLVSDALRHVLSAAPEIRALAEARDVTSALQHLRECDWSVMVIDLMLQGCGGVGVIAQVRALRPRMPILALCRHGHDLCAQRALASGASGYVGSAADGEELLGALRTVVRGGRYSGAAPAGGRVARGARLLGAPLHESLSRREFEVFRLIGGGRTPTQIASALSLSVKTVATYRARIFGKLELRSSAELMRYAFSNKLVH